MLTASLMGLIALGQKLNENIPDKDAMKFYDIAWRLDDALFPSSKCFRRDKSYFDAITASHQLLAAIPKYPVVAATLTDADFRFIVDSFNRYAWVAPFVQYDIKDGRALVWRAYKSKYGYTPTPEIDQTPDQHWAKISLDLLYKQGIFKGDKP